MVKTSDEFYKELGVEGLAKRKTAVHTRKELSYLKKLLSKSKKILDLACGYGRFTIPLFKQGYDIQGLDISPNLLKEARKRANEENLKIKFVLGDMLKLPYKKETFDNIICMWSAFIELKNKKDQVKAIREMLRVLRDGGFAILEMANFPKVSQLAKNSDVKSVRGNVLCTEIDGVVSNPHYIHSRKTLKDVLIRASVGRFKIFVDDFGGRKRLFVQFWK